MTRAQKTIEKYIWKNYEPGGVILSQVGDMSTKITDMTGGSMTFTINLYGDIMDAENGKILAVSNVPHDLDKVGFMLSDDWIEFDR